MKALALPDAHHLAELETSESAGALESARAVKITGADDYRMAVKMIAAVKDRRARVDGVRTSIVEPMKKAVATVDDVLKPVTENYFQAEQELKRKVIEWRTEHEAPKLSGVVVKHSWGGEVTDASLIPREYLVPDERLLAAITKAKDGEVSIPGWQPKQSTYVAIGQVSR